MLPVWSKALDMEGQNAACQCVLCQIFINGFFNIYVLSFFLSWVCLSWHNFSTTTYKLEDTETVVKVMARERKSFQLKVLMRNKTDKRKFSGASQRAAQRHCQFPCWATSCGAGGSARLWGKKKNNIFSHLFFPLSFLSRLWGRRKKLKQNFFSHVFLFLCVYLHLSLRVSLSSYSHFNSKRNSAGSAVKEMKKTQKNSLPMCFFSEQCHCLFFILINNFK